MDTRLRASASNNTLNSQSSRHRRSALAGSPRSGANSRPPSVAPVITHSQVLESSGAIQSREQLYDILNKDDDQEDMDYMSGAWRQQRDGDTDNELRDNSSFYLTKPRPEFLSRSSNRSSRRSSSESSTVNANSDIELNSRPSRAAKLGGEGISSSNVSAAPSVSEKRATMYENSAFHGEYAELTLKTEKSAWLRSKNRTTRKWKSICCAVGIVALIAAVSGIVLGFVLRKGKVDGLAPPHDPENPTSTIPPITHFTPDPNLRKAFYGVAYNPAKSLMPWCGVTLQAVIDDLILISQITNRVRLYGMDCQQADLTFQAIKALGLKMEVVLTLWVDKDPVTIQRQHDTLFNVLDAHGTDMLTGVSVGNEALFRKDMDLATLGNLMATVRSELIARYNKAIPVFTSEIGSNMDSSLAAVSDMLQGNLHPYFSGTSAQMAANWTLAEYESKIAEYPVSSGLKGVISEIGWPTAPASAVYLNGAVPGLANMQTLVDSFVCQANAAGIPYYWFEFRDEPWKVNPEVPVEPYWGIFDKDAKLKIKIPNCIAP
ncbi:hypothetical protein BG011_003870 [Mortierella polycephala]|uniref:glucan endo-1,3-beta-D-glucosidase n=1 Tax=Mortierella polycephala TaxID=41804 RepID=A0A9P6Q331_9FUNG|nr:hypothetical protein BG011_003870 [Mortierella polycephala]